jgi:phospholipid/cholesterol/gamma-HCH transport system ATP-binding protein
MVQEKLDWVGLPDAAFKMPSELSGGMKKRIGLARAIVANPEVILYDEPTAGLDPINTVRIADVIMDLKERIKCTSIVVTHDIPVAQRLSDRAAFLYDGKVKALGTMAELANSPDRFVKGFLAADSSLAD